MVNVPSVVKDTGVFASIGGGAVTRGTSSSNVHVAGSVFLLVAHCVKCSVLGSLLSTRIEPSGTEQRAWPSSFASSTVTVQPTAELTAVIRSPIAESNTAVKALFPTSESATNCVSPAALPGPPRAASNPTVAVSLPIRTLRPPRWEEIRRRVAGRYIDAAGTQPTSVRPTRGAAFVTARRSEPTGRTRWRRALRTGRRRPRPEAGAR